MTDLAEKIVPLRLLRSGGGASETEPPADQGLPDGCPIQPIGYHDGAFFFIGMSGEIRKLTARALGSVPEMTGLFMGSTEWLEQHYPQRKVKLVTVGGETQAVTEETGYSVKQASAALMRACQEAGHFGPHIVIRKPGIWRGADGSPVVHVGTRIAFNGKWYRAGQRIGDTIWVTGPQRAGPGTPCNTAHGRDMVDGLRTIWNWQYDGGPIMAAGLIAAAYYGGAAVWRPSGFFVGPAATGKTSLLEAIAACLPMHEFTNDTSAAGVTGVMNGHAMPVVIDEASDRDPEGARRLMDIVLASTGGEGVRGLRGTADGGVRSTTLMASFFYGSTAAPPLGPTHLGRITLVELAPATAGAYGRDAMQAFSTRMKDAGPDIWARMLARFGDWKLAMTQFQEGLRRAGCAPREVDQNSAILAAHHVLTEDGLPTDRQVRSAITAIRDFIRTAEEVRDDDNPRRVAEHLLMQRIQYDSTTRLETVGNMVARAFNVTESGADPGHADARNAIEVLMRYGLRPVRAWETKDSQGRRVPRLGDGDGIWMLPTGVRQMFRGTPFEVSDRWAVELCRLQGARRSKSNVRIGGASGKAIWLPRAGLDRGEPIGCAEMVARLGVSMTVFVGLMERYGDQFPIVDRVGMVDEWTFDPDHVTGFLERQENIDSG